MNMIKYLRGTWWGSDPVTLLTFYKSYVRSIVDYGIFVYFPNKKDLSDKLEKIQYSAIRFALGYRNTTPTNILLSESKLTFIKDRALFLCENFFFKTMSNSNLLSYNVIENYHRQNKHRTRRKNERILEKCILDNFNQTKKLSITSNFQIYNYDYYTTITSIPINTEVGERMKKTGETDPLKIINLKDASQVSIYTDGSKIPDNVSVGSACFSPNLDIKISKSIDHISSVYTAECLALSEAMGIASSQVDTNILIFSDSLSALMSLQNPKLNIKVNPYIHKTRDMYLRCIEQFEKNNKQINLYWIPAHTGIEGNEEVDALAKSATEDEPDSTCLPFTDFRELSKMKSLQNTNKVLTTLGLSKGKEYFNKYHSESVKPWFYYYQAPREFVVFVNRARSNHYHLAASLARTGLIDDPRCQCGHDSEDLNHVLWQCPLYSNTRDTLLFHLHNLNFHPPYNIETFLDTKHIKALKFIFQFLSKENIKI